ncbi:MAG: recombination regulator RecX [Actinomycetota bacterium]|nr:recombination regulator RecX [Actinomycetota bacterium]
MARRSPATPEDTKAAGPPEDPEGVARQILLRRLTEQPRTRAELATALAKRRVPDEVAARVLDRFGEVGLVDDAAFARAWVESRHGGRGLGRRALAHELRRKGVDNEVAQEAVAAVGDDEELAAAKSLVDRKLPGLRRLDRARAERRLMGLLGRRGFPLGLARSVVRDALRERPYDPAVDPAGERDMPLDLP